MIVSCKTCAWFNTCLPTEKLIGPSCTSQCPDTYKRLVATALAPIYTAHLQHAGVMIRYAESRSSSAHGGISTAFYTLVAAVDVVQGLTLDAGQTGVL